MSRITALPILKASSCLDAGVCKKYTRVGKMSADTDSSASVAIMRGTSEAKRCVPWRKPPTKKASPSTSRLFPRIEPTSAAWITAISPLRSAKYPTKSSGKLPSEDCNTPVAPGPRCEPSCSVPMPTRAASSARATPETTKVRTALACMTVSSPATTLNATDPPVISHSLRLIKPSTCFSSILVFLTSLSLSKQYWTLVVARVTDCTFPKDPYFNKFQGVSYQACPTNYSTSHST